MLVLALCPQVPVITMLLRFEMLPLCQVQVNGPLLTLCWHWQTTCCQLDVLSFVVAARHDNNSRDI